MTIPWFALRFQRREETDALKLAIREAEDRPVREKPATISFFLPYGFRVRFDDHE